MTPDQEEITEAQADSEESGSAEQSAPDKKKTAFILLLLLPLLYLIHLKLEQDASWILHVRRSEVKQLMFFFGGFAVAVMFCMAPAMEGLRTILHELRHAVMVILTVNKLEKFKFYSRRERDEGERDVLAQVFWEMRTLGWGRWTAPLVTMAPYSFPILSLPVAAGGLFFLGRDPGMVTALFGLAFGIDLGTACRDFFDTGNFTGDLTKYAGGALVSIPFALMTNLVVIDLASLWLKHAVAYMANYSL